MKKKHLYPLFLSVTILFFISADRFHPGKRNDPVHKLLNGPKFILIQDSTENDLTFLDNILKEKRIVLLGESAHGVNEFSCIKFRLIKYLHEKLHFNTIFFESGISECAYIHLQQDALSGEEMVKEGLFCVWHTEENVRLMKYIKENHIGVYGIDNQYTSDKYSEVIKVIGGALDIQSAMKVYTLDTMISGLFLSKDLYSKNSNAVKERFSDLRTIAINSYTHFMFQIDMVLQKENVDSEAQTSFLLLKKILINKLYRIRSVTNHNEYFMKRDSVMASNFKFLADTLNKGSKIIVWAHNSHISKTGSQNPTSYLGKLLHEQYDHQLYGIGLYAYKGELMDNQRRGTIILEKPLNHSLEHHLHELRDTTVPEDKALFQDFDHLTIDPYNHWLSEMIPAFGWSNAIVPLNEYNGVMLIEKVTIPRYID